MPNAFMSIETSFPTFKEGQNTEDKINSMVNYLFILVEQLRYTLNNLDSTNWNSKALEDLKIESTADIESNLELLATQLNQVAQTVASLSAQVANLTGLPERMSIEEGKTAGLEQWRDGVTDPDTQEHTPGAEERIQALEAAVTVLNDWVNGTTDPDTGIHTPGAEERIEALENA